MSHGHGPDVSEAQYCRVCIDQRTAPQLAVHAGHKPWGVNDGSVRGVLQAWGLQPEDFVESLNGWGYEIVSRNLGVDDPEPPAKDGL